MIITTLMRFIYQAHLKVPKDSLQKKVKTHQNKIHRLEMLKNTQTIKSKAD